MTVASAAPFGRTDYKPEPVARAALRHFIDDFDPRLDSLPKRIEPALVERVLHEEVQRGRPASDRAGRMVELADFYGTSGIVADWLAQLDRTEKTDDALQSSLQFIAAAGLFGDREQQAAARSYYHHVLSLPFAEAHMADLLTCYASLAPAETPGLTLGRIDGILAALRPRADADYAAGVSYRTIDNLRSNTVPRIENGLALAAEILAAADPTARVARLVEVYLGFDERYHEIVFPRAVRQLLREAREGRAQLLVTQLRASLHKLAGRPAEEAWRARAVHAIEFFGGALSPEEQSAVRPENKRYDILSTD